MKVRRRMAQDFIADSPDGHFVEPGVGRESYGIKLGGCCGDE